MKLMMLCMDDVPYNTCLCRTSKCRVHLVWYEPRHLIMDAPLSLLPVFENLQTWKMNFEYVHFTYWAFESSPNWLRWSALTISGTLLHSSSCSLSHHIARGYFSPWHCQLDICSDVFGQRVTHRKVHPKSPLMLMSRLDLHILRPNSHFRIVAY